MNIGTATITSSVGVTLPGIEPSEPGACFEAVLPWGRSVNQHWRHVAMGKSVRVLLSEDGRKYRAAVVKAVGEVRPLAGPLVFIGTFHPPTLARMDLDNRLKPLLDALTAAGVWTDDSQVREIRARFGPVDRSGGRVVVRIVPLAEAE